MEITSVNVHKIEKEGKKTQEISCYLSSKN